MDKKKPYLTYERAHQLFNYDARTGKLYWKITKGGIKAGKEAGFIDSEGYRYLGCDKKCYFAHRIIWLMWYGKWPKDEIDHIDKNRLNNSIQNLRDTTHQQNQKNRKLSKNSTSGTLGVYWCQGRKRWCPEIQVNKKRIRLGYFKNKEGAIAARKAAENKYGFHKNHGCK